MIVYNPVKGVIFMEGNLKLVNTDEIILYPIIKDLVTNNAGIWVVEYNHPTANIEKRIYSSISEDKNIKIFKLYTNNKKYLCLKYLHDIEDFRETVALNAKLEQAILEGNYEDAINIGNKLIASYCHTYIGVYYYVSYAYYKLGNLNQAYAYYLVGNKKTYGKEKDLIPEPAILEELTSTFFSKNNLDEVIKRLNNQEKLSTILESYNNSEKCLIYLALAKEFYKEGLTSYGDALIKLTEKTKEKNRMVKEILQDTRLKKQAYLSGEELSLVRNLSSFIM